MCIYMCRRISIRKCQNISTMWILPSETVHADMFTWAENTWMQHQSLWFISWHLIAASHLRSCSYSYLFWLFEKWRPVAVSGSMKLKLSTAEYAGTMTSRSIQNISFHQLSLTLLFFWNANLFPSAKYINFYSIRELKKLCHTTYYISSDFLRGHEITKRT